jgi:hypothetical protein
MKNIAILVTVLTLAGSAATYARYESLSPCDWMAQDLTRQTDMPLIVSQSRVRANFLIQGITEPNPYECVLAWWKFRAEGGLAL